MKLAPHITKRELSLPKSNASYLGNIKHKGYFSFLAKFKLNVKLSHCNHDLSALSLLTLSSGRAFDCFKDTAHKAFCKCIVLRLHVDKMPCNYMK